MDKKTEFIQLLQRYLNNTITPKEYNELMEIIRKGTYDDYLKGNIDKLLKDDTNVTDMEEDKARKILHYIFATEKENKRDILKQRPTKRYSYWVGAVAASLVIMLIVAGGLVFKRESVEKNILSDGQELKQTGPSFFSGKQFVKLPDASSVLLNEKSELSYDSSFGNGFREVKLTGEAYFDIQHDTSRPFLVHTRGLTITVLGTAFNVKAYPTEKEIKVTVTRGKVRVGNDEQTYGVITPDEQLVVNTDTHQFIQSRVNAESAIAWKSQYLILDDLSMEEAMKKIAEKYGVSINFSDDDIKKYRITATFLNGESLEHVLTVVSGVIDGTYTIDDHGNILIEEK